MSERTLIPNGRAIRRLRKALGWAQEEFEHQTGLTVEEKAAAEQAAGNQHGAFTRHMRKRQRQKKFVGISKSTISSAENSKRVYAMTLHIIAATLGVEPSKIAQEEDETDSTAMMQAFEEAFLRLLEEIGIERTMEFARQIAALVEVASRRDRDSLTAKCDDHDTDDS
jgi:transcriptional regulator with XRE-family HTH domain